MDVTESGSWRLAGLGDAEARYGALFEHSGDALFVLEGGVFVECNRAAEGLFGAPRERIVGATPWEFSPPAQPDGRSSEDAACDRIAAAVAGTPQRFEWVHRRADGTDIRCEVSLSRFEAGGGPLVLAAVRDVEAVRSAAEALAESEARYRTLFEAASDAILVFDPETEEILDANPAACAMYGLPREELLGRSLREFSTGVRRGERAIREALEAGGIRRYKTVHRRADGAEIALVANASVAELGGRRVIVSVNRDVTEDRRREARLRLLARALENVGEAVVITGPDDRIRWVNPAFERLYGYGAAELEGRHIGIVRPPDLPPEVGETIRASTLAGGWRGELPNRTRDGRELLVELVTSPVRDPEGRVEAFIGVARDVTAERARQRALAESEARFRSFFDNDIAANFISTWDGRIVACNRRFLEIFGFGSAEEAAAASAWDLYPSPGAREGLLAALEAAGSVQDLELELATRDGRRIHALLNAVLLRDAEGRPRQIQGHLVDITPLRETEAQLLEAQKMEAIGRLAGGVAHDFNNLLQAMLMDVELARLKGTADPELLGRIEAQVRRGAALARQLLLFSRRGERRTERVDLARLLADDSKMLRRLLPENIALEVRTPEGEVPVEADPVQLEQVLMNLVVNAKDAMPEGGRLEIALERRDGSAALTVADTGHGIPPEVRDRIFEPFFTTKERGRGTGLGLSVVHGVVTAHGGSVAVESEPGRGTTFTVELPLAGGGGAARKAEGGRLQPVAAPEARGHRVLLVEDDPATRAVTAEMLAALGYEVEAAADLAAARLLAEGREFDLLVADVVLPDGSGAAFAAELRARRPRMGIVLVSGYPEDELPARRGLRGPGLAFLPKPFDAPALARAMAEAARGGRG